VVKVKKTIFASLIIVCLLFLMFSTKCETSVKANDYTIHVQAGQSIQEAINNASAGYTIFVEKGVYSENVVVNKSIALIGEDVNLTIIDGKGTIGNGSVIHVNVSYVTIHGFTIRNSGIKQPDSGIYLDHSIGSNISGNKILSNNDGIGLYYSSGNLISSNVISSNYYSGVALGASSNNVIEYNILSSNIYGVYLYLSGGNMVSDNTLYSNYDGFYLISSSNKNVISGNNVSASLNFGIYCVSDSANNTFYHNNMINDINDSKNVESDAINVWDYDGEGNYWHDYDGQDLDGDGIGDTPYNVNSYKDNYPLMGPFSDFKIVWEKETYSVTTISNSTISDFNFQVGKETGNKIISFNTTNVNGVAGFCRIKIPTALMDYPNIILVDNEEVVPTKLDAPNETYACLYFTYSHDCVVTIISSESLRQYYELLDKYLEVQESFSELNDTYNSLLASFASLQLGLYGLNETYLALLASFTALQSDMYILNEMYSNVSDNYAILLGNYSQLQKNFEELNISYQTLYSLNQTYYVLINNYNQLKLSFDELNNSYQEHLLDYSQQIENTRNLLYIFVATTAIFLIVTFYLSKRVHAGSAIKTKAIEEK
jgi:nitrous oxidase accessory protein